MTTKEQFYISHFKSSRKSPIGRLTWLPEIQQEALNTFEQLGFPTARRGNEEWKYTDITPVATGQFTIPNNQGSQQNTVANLDQYTFAGTKLSSLVFIDGFYSKALSNTEALPSEITIGGLSDITNPQMVPGLRYLTQNDDHLKKSFNALNTALFQDVAILDVPDNVEVTGPVQFLFLSSPGHHPSATFPRILINLGIGATATIVETHADQATSPNFSNVVSEITLAENSSLTHFMLQTNNASAFHVSSLHVKQATGSSYSSFVFDTGGGLVRHDLDLLLGGPGANCNLQGLYLLNGQQHVDYSTFVDHAAPHTSSSELYKGVLQNSSHVVFGGKMLVRPDSQMIVSEQTNKTLLLSQGAKVDTKPQLEIYADDVKCNHGAAIGQLDHEALFYLQSRGLNQRKAQDLLTYGFVSEVTNNVTNIPFRAYLESQVQSRLRTI